MKKYFLALTAILLINQSPVLLAEECKDIILNLIDDNPAPGIKGPKVFMILDCHEGTADYHTASTINFMYYSRGKICHGHRVCGNVKGWEGQFRVGAAWDFINAKLGDAQAAATRAGIGSGSGSGSGTEGITPDTGCTTAEPYYAHGHTECANFAGWHKCIPKATFDSQCSATITMDTGCSAATPYYAHGHRAECPNFLNQHACISVSTYNSTCVRANASPQLLTSLNNAPEWIKTAIGYNNYPEMGSCEQQGKPGHIYTNEDQTCGGKLPPHTCIPQAEYDAACSGSTGGATGVTGTSGYNSGGYGSGYGYSTFPVRNGVFAEFTTSFLNMKRYCSEMQNWSCLDLPQFPSN